MHTFLQILYDPAWRYACGITGGPLLIIGLFTWKFRPASPWLRKIQWSAGSSAFCWGVAGIIHYYGYHRLGSRLRPGLYDIEQMFAGAALALLLLLVFSAEFWRLNNSRPQVHQELKPTLEDLEDHREPAAAK